MVTCLTDQKSGQITSNNVDSSEQCDTFSITILGVRQAGSCPPG